MSEQTKKPITRCFKCNAIMKVTKEIRLPDMNGDLMAFDELECPNKCDLTKWLLGNLDEK